MSEQILYKCPANSNHLLRGYSRYQKHLKKCKEFSKLQNKPQNAELLQPFSKEDSKEDRKKLSLLVQRVKENQAPQNPYYFDKQEVNSKLLSKKLKKRDSKKEEKAFNRLSQETQNKTNFKCMLTVGPFLGLPESSNTLESKTKNIEQKQSLISSENQVVANKERQLSEKKKKSKQAHNQKQNSIENLQKFVLKFIPQISRKSTTLSTEKTNKKLSETNNQDQLKTVIGDLKNSQEETVLSSKEISIELVSDREDEQQKKGKEQKIKQNLLPQLSLSTAISLEAAEVCIICEAGERKAALGCGHSQMCNDCFQGLFHFAASQMRCIECQKKRIEIS